jgi:hypothetical protein
MSEKTTARDKSRATDDEPSEKVQKRAQWESFAFAVVEPRTVRVENHSYGKDAVDDHTYRIEIEHGSAVACSCPADEHHPGPCKHRTAVEQNTPVLPAASGVVADGGVIEADDATLQEDSADGDTDERPDDCECEPWMDSVDLPCFECHSAGYDRPNTDVLEDGEADD